jgi:tetratricopeptide (TPR) repeat protein
VKSKTVRRAPKPSGKRLRSRLGAALEQLQRAELLRGSSADDADFIFKHVLVQDIAYASLLRQDKQTLHRKVAQAYETLYADRCLDEFAALLAQHSEAAGDNARTLLYATRAGDRAAQSYAHVEAVTFYTTALASAQDGGATSTQLAHLYTKRGRALELSGQHVKAMENYAEMEALARRRGEASLELESLTLRVTILATATSVFDPARAQQLSDRAMGLADELGDRAAKCRVLWNLLVLNRYTDQSATALEYGDQALALARELGLHELLAFVATDLGGVCMSLGQIARAQALFDEARPLWRELDNKPMLADNLMLSGTLALLKGDYARTLDYTSEGAELSQKIGTVLGQSSNLGTQIQVWVARGEFAHALRIAQTMVDLVGRGEYQFFLPLQYGLLAWLYAQVGAVERAAQGVQLARAHLTMTLPPFLRGWALALLAQTYILVGNLATAREMLAVTRAGAPAAEVVSPQNLLETLALGELDLANGDTNQAIRRMQAFVERYRRLGLRPTLSNALYLEARALQMQGETDRAIDLLEQARAEAESLPSRPVLWQVLALLGELEAERGHSSKSTELYARAREVIAFLAERVPPDLRESFLNQPRVSALLDHEPDSRVD